MTEEERQSIRREAFSEAYDAIAKHRFKCVYYPVPRGRPEPLLGPRDYKNEVYSLLQRLAAGEST